MKTFIARLLFTTGLDLGRLYHEIGIIRTTLDHNRGEVCVVDANLKTVRRDIWIVFLDHCEQDPFGYVESELRDFPSSEEAPEITLMLFVYEKLMDPKALEVFVAGWRNRYRDANHRIHTYRDSGAVLSILAAWAKDRNEKLAIAEAEAKAVEEHLKQIAMANLRPAFP